MAVNYVKRPSLTIASVIVGGQRLSEICDEHRIPVFGFEAIADAGWIRITSIGNENLYFDFRDDAGDVHHGFCKCL